ncbi:MAG: M67 family metallopeptidase, partial [Cyanobacteria bacterium P01_D01_bin.73]
IAHCPLSSPIPMTPVPMTLYLSAEDQTKIFRAGEAAFPRECCGILLGRLKRDKDGAAIAQVMEVHPVDNAWTSDYNEKFDVIPGAQETAERRFTIDPRDLFRLQKLGRDRGFDIIGIYHSHPNHPAVPSDFDRTYAWANYSYPIVAVHHGKAVDLRSWRLDQSGQFQRETIQPVPSFSVATPVNN